MSQTYSAWDEIRYCVTLFKVDMKLKILFHDMKVQENLERTPLTDRILISFLVTEMSIFKKCKMAPKVVHHRQKFDETLTETAKCVTLIGLHVSRQIMKSAITY